VLDFNRNTATAIAALAHLLSEASAFGMMLLALLQSAAALAHLSKQTANLG
jgi:hypothetical protein